MDFSSTGAMRSPFSPRVRQSLSSRRPGGLSTAKKSQSKFMQSQSEPTGDVIYKTPTMTLETYGAPMPVTVTEALAFASGDISVRISPCGWCWVVSGRRILAWEQSSLDDDEDAGNVTGISAARELTLPQTDLAHKADLVVVFYENDSQMPSCIGVSPEGVIRYWPSVGQEEVYVDVTCELAGQECEKLGEYTSSGLILATTTCTVVLLTPAVVDGRATVNCCTLRPPSGWLGGIGRRVSLLFFGSMPAHTDTRLVGAVWAGECVWLVARGPVLQVWRPPALLHQHSLRTPLALAARPHLQPHAGDLNSLEIMALDVQSGGKDSILLLIAAVNVTRSPDMRYAIAHINVEDPSAPRVTSLVPVRSFPSEAEEPPRFLPFNNRALLYTSKYIALTSLSGTSDTEVMEVGSGDRVLSAARCPHGPALFTTAHGLLALSLHSHAATVCDSPISTSSQADLYEGNLALYEIDPREVSSVATDVCGRVKVAFLHHVRREADACRAALDDALPPHHHHDVDATLDRAVVTVAMEILDDMPAGDPRWKRQSGQATNIPLGSSTALQIEAQLRDKQRALALFYEFLRATGLWQRLGLVTVENEGVCSSESVLCTAWERALGAAGLRRLQHGPHAAFIDSVICETVRGWRDAESGVLSPSDVCYRRVSRLNDVLLVLARPVPTDRPNALAVLSSVLLEMLKGRSSWRAVSPPPLGGEALFAPVIQLIHKSFTEFENKTGEPTLRAQMSEHAASLAEVVLGGAHSLSEEPHAHHLYCKLRRELIRPFVDEKEWERAASLAEKFKDFELLVEICVNNNDMEKLTNYVDKYAEEGMAEITYEWLSSKGGRPAAALVKGVGGGVRLSAWLRNQRPDLLALHHVQRGEHSGAAAALCNLAHRETDNLDRMATLASLSKLCLLVSEDDPESSTRRDVERRLALVEQHAAVPRDVLAHHGLRAESMPVLDPEDLAMMYVDCDSSGVTEYDYKKALDLTDYIQDHNQKEVLRIRIWIASILRDDWSACSAETVNDDIMNKTFFRLIDLVNVMGGDLEVLLPEFEELITSPELAELAEDPNIHYILKYGYECLHTRLMHHD